MKLFALIAASVLTNLVFCQKYTTPPSMAFVKGGTYMPLFSNDAGKVEVQPFYMDIYPVTNADFLKFVKANPDWMRSKVKRLFADSNYLKQWDNDLSFNKSIAQSPVVNISWFAAKKYCECQGKRLAETSEWELVAKASKTRADASKDPHFNQWLLDWVSTSNPDTLPGVGSTFRNFYGIYDLHGLVWEWTFDFNNALTTGESRGNNTPNNSMFCGGGSFSSRDLNNYASFMRFAMRSSVKAKYCVANLGFRCVK